MNHDSRLRETIELVRKLKRTGIDRLTVIARHSARRYDSENPQFEPFLGLTDKGKELALELGRSLPDFTLVRFYSSPVVRCVETAYQAEKGCIENGLDTEVPKLSGVLTGFFVKNAAEAFGNYFERGSEVFFRSWFNGELTDIMADAEESASKLTAFLVGRLKGTRGGQLNFCVSHDWNLYLLREICLHQRQEEHGPAMFLESIAVFERDGRPYMVNHVGDPIPIE